ncbi:MAG: heme o synthase [Planctomycetota bacterium]|jgi:protoheme IX farnesyltransferase
MSLLSSSANQALPIGRRDALRGLVGLYLQLAKARLSALVLLTTAVGFVMGSPRAAGIDWVTLLLTVVGTGLAAGAANALNQVIEARRDRLMRRTRARPLPSRAIGPGHAVLFAVLSAGAGLALLALTVNLTAAGLALATICIYIGLYTPLKTRSTLNTVVGAVCGAIPPMIGWAAATGSLEPGAWILGTLLFVWQIPHFFALAWLYRDDYARGGFAMLPVVDRTGRLTGQVVVLTSLSLVPLALAATLAGLSGGVYAAGSVLLGLWILNFGARLYAQRTEASARRLFLASIVYLPLLLCLMVADRGPLEGVTVGGRAVASTPAE